MNIFFLVLVAVQILHFTVNYYQERNYLLLKIKFNISIRIIKTWIQNNLQFHSIYVFNILKSSWVI